MLNECKKDASCLELAYEMFDRSGIVQEEKKAYETWCLNENYKFVTDLK